MALTPTTVVLTTAVSIFLLVMFCWFAWALMGIRKIWYRISKKKQINAVLDLLYDNEENHMFKHERVEKYIKLGFYNPVIFEMAEKLYYNQRNRINKLNVIQEKKNGRTKQIPKPIPSRQVESFEIPNEEYAEPEPAEYLAPAPASAGAGARGVPRATAPAIRPATARVEPRADTNYPARAPTNSQVARQRDLQDRDVEKPRTKSRYFG